MKLLALLVATGLPVVAFADMLGAHLPSVIDAASLTGVFSAVSLGLMLLNEYSGRSPARSFKVAYHKATTETHRLAA